MATSHRGAVACDYKPFLEKQFGTLVKPFRKGPRPHYERAKREAFSASPIFRSAQARKTKRYLKCDMEQTHWRLLVERYARRAREYSDAVARLGRANLPVAECHELLEAIKARHKSCMAAAEEIDRYVKQDADTAHNP